MLDRLFHVPTEFSQRRPNSGFDSRVLPGSRVSLRHLGRHLEGLQKFYLLNWTNIVATLARAVLIIYVLRHGLGLLSVALITVSLPLIASAVRAVIRSAIAGHSLRMEICEPGFASAGGELRLGHFYDHRGRAIEVQN